MNQIKFSITKLGPNNFSIQHGRRNDIIIRRLTRQNLERKFGKQRWIMDLLKKLLELHSLPNNSVEEFTLEECEPEVEFIVRGIRDKDADGERVNKFPVKINYDFKETVIKWSSDSYICLDIDGDCIFDWTNYGSIRPLHAWRSHSGKGFHLIFKTESEWTARERASLKAFEVLSKEPYVRVELKRDTRHPLSLRDGQKCGPVIDWIQTDDFSFIKSIMFEEDKTVQTEKDKWNIGQRYDHSHCPFSPGLRGEREPVIALEDRIHCHRCGRSISWSQLSGSFRTTKVAEMVKNFVNWGHAECVFRHLYNEPIAIMKEVYRTLLIMHHGRDDLRIDYAFTDITSLTTRYWYNGGFGNKTGEPHRKYTDRIVGSLPICKDASMRAKPGYAGVLSEPGSKTAIDYGYYPLARISGAPIYYQFNKPAKEYIPVSIYEDLSEDRYPRYLQPEARLSEEESWKILERPFPGIDRRLIELLIAAKGCYESDQAVVPTILITGPTKSGKSVSAIIAASILGDNAEACILSKEDERNRQAIKNGATQGSFVVFNEMYKAGSKSRMTPVETSDFLLNLTPRSISHELYLGPTRLGKVPVIIITDTTVPLPIKYDAQLGRRIIHASMNGSLEIENSIHQYFGCSNVSDLRKVEDRTYCDAADSLISYIIDRHFKDGYRLFADIATSIGYPTILEEFKAERHDKLKEFHRLYKSESSQWVPVDNGGIADLYNDIGGERTLNGEDWAKIIGVSGQWRSDQQKGRQVVSFEERLVKV